jgi:hypothetical protein
MPSSRRMAAGTTTRPFGPTFTGTGFTLEIVTHLALSVTSVRK